MASVMVSIMVLVIARAELTGLKERTAWERFLVAPLIKDG